MTIHNCTGLNKLTMRFFLSVRLNATTRTSSFSITAQNEQKIERSQCNFTFCNDLYSISYSTFLRALRNAVQPSYSIENMVTLTCLVHGLQKY